MKFFRKKHSKPSLKSLAQFAGRVWQSQPLEITVGNTLYDLKINELPSGWFVLNVGGAANFREIIFQHHAMRNNKKVFLILAVAVGLLMVFRYGCFQASLAYDAYSRPWAYGAEPLLVGVWSGELRDPDGTNWKIRLEIFEPTTSEERWRRIDRPRKVAPRTERTFMDGIACTGSGRRRDTLEIWGGLDEASAPTSVCISRRKRSTMCTRSASTLECRRPINGNCNKLGFPAVSFFTAPAITTAKTRDLSTAPNACLNNSFPQIQDLGKLKPTHICHETHSLFVFFAAGSAIVRKTMPKHRRPTPPKSENGHRRKARRPSNSTTAPRPMPMCPFRPAIFWKSSTGPKTVWPRVLSPPKRFLAQPGTALATRKRGGIDTGLHLAGQSTRSTVLWTKPPINH